MNDEAGWKDVGVLEALPLKGKSFSRLTEKNQNEIFNGFIRRGMQFSSEDIKRSNVSRIYNISAAPKTVLYRFYSSFNSNEV